MLQYILNCLITLTGLSVVILLLWQQYPKIEKWLVEKLQLSLEGSHDNYGILGEIFYLYKHKSSQAWLDWILAQTEEDKTIAYNLLLKHIEKPIDKWGGVTQEAIVTLGYFSKPDLIEQLNKIIEQCKKHWEKFKLSKRWYQSALKASIVDSEDSAVKLFEQEITNINFEEQANPIIKTLEDFDEETNLKPLIQQIITNEKINYIAKASTLEFIKNRNEDQALEVACEGCEHYLSKQKPSIDDLKIFDDLLHIIISNMANINETGFKLLYAACTHDALSATAIRVTEENLKKSPEIFSAKELYKLINLSTDKNRVIQQCLENYFELNNDEKKLVQQEDLENLYSFTKGPYIQQDIKESFFIPEIAAESYDQLKSLFKQNIINQNGINGILLSGKKSNLEKNIFTRNLASERQWKFIYVAIEDIFSSANSNIQRQLIEAITSSKPCLLFLEGVDVLYTQSNNISPNFYQIISDPLVNVFGAINQDIAINENHDFQLQNSNPSIERIFNKGYSIKNPDENLKNVFISSKITKLETNRNQQSFKDLHITQPTQNHSLFEFDDFLNQYFKGSLLTSGKLLPIEEFLDIQSQEGIK